MTKNEIVQLLYAACDRYGIDRAIGYWMIYHESRFNPQAKNPGSTATGLGQFIAATWAAYGRGSIYDPATHVDAYGRLMRDLLRQFGGDYSKAIAAYSQGAGSVSRGNAYSAQSREMIAFVLGLKAMFGAPATYFEPTQAQVDAARAGNFSSSGTVNGSVLVFLLVALIAVRLLR